MVLQRDLKAGSANGPENLSGMRSTVDDRADLELALLRRGVVERAADVPRCGRCQRTPLVGERVYIYDHDSVRCELCRSDERRPALTSHVVHGPEFGHTMRIHDRRAA
jgi:hypothetical protein